MTINYLSDAIERTKVVTSMNKFTEIDGVLYQLAGIHHSDRGDQLILLLHDPGFDKFAYREMPNLKTNRDYLNFHENREPNNPLGNVESVSFGDVTIQVTQAEMSLIQKDQFDSILLLEAFLKAGWNPTNLMELPLDSLHIYKLTLDSQPHDLPDDLNGPLVFNMRQVPRSFPIRKPVKLIVGDEVDRIHILDPETGKPHWIQINSVYLMDIWTEMQENYKKAEQMEHGRSEDFELSKKNMEVHLREICLPEDRLPVINYETDTDFSIQVYAKSYLDDEHKSRSGAIGFIIGADKPTGKAGNKLKATLVQTPVNIDTKEVEVEIYCGTFLERRDPVKMI